MFVVATDLRTQGIRARPGRAVLQLDTAGIFGLDHGAIASLWAEGRRRLTARMGAPSRTASRRGAGSPVRSFQRTVVGAPCRAAWLTERSVARAPDPEPWRLGRPPGPGRRSRGRRQWSEPFSRSPPEAMGLVASCSERGRVRLHGPGKQLRVPGSPVSVSVRTCAAGKLGWAGHIAGRPGGGRCG